MFFNIFAHVTSWLFANAAGAHQRSGEALVVWTFRYRENILFFRNTFSKMNSSASRLVLFAQQMCLVYGADYCWKHQEARMGSSHSSVTQRLWEFPAIEMKSFFPRIRPSLMECTSWPVSFKQLLSVRHSSEVTSTCAFEWKYLIELIRPPIEILKLKKNTSFQILIWKKCLSPHQPWQRT